MKQDHFYCGQFYAHNQNLQTEAQVLSNFYSGQFYVHNQNLQTEDQILSNFYPGQFYVHNQKKQTEAQILSPALYIDAKYSLLVSKFSYPAPTNTQSSKL